MVANNNIMFLELLLVEFIEFLMYAYTTYIV